MTSPLATCRYLIGWIVLILALASPALAQEPPAAAAPSDYRIVAGDQLALKFFYAPELNESVTVRPDGKINLLLVGDVQAAGLAPAQLAQQLRAAYTQTLRYPEVAVEIEKGFGMQQIFVGGEVTHPGVQPLTPSLTLMRALIAAQGLKDSAAPSRVLILRRDANGASQVTKIDVATQMRGGHASDPVLQPYDVVLVPPSRVARLNKWIDLYIRRNLPVSVGFSYDLNNDRQD